MTSAVVEGVRNTLLSRSAAPGVMIRLNKSSDQEKLLKKNYLSNLLFFTFVLDITKKKKGSASEDLAKFHFNSLLG